MNGDSELGGVTREGRALLTDLYQLTMAYGYWKSGRAEREAVFHLFFRHSPFQCGFTLTAGLAPTIEFLQAFQFRENDLAFLGTLRGNDNRPLFDRGFLDYLGTLRFGCDVDGIPEGTAVFPQEPLLRIQGPILQCQLFETALLNPINFQSLIATKAARVCVASRCWNSDCVGHKAWTARWRPAALLTSAVVRPHRMVLPQSPMGFPRAGLMPTVG